MVIGPGELGLCVSGMGVDLDGHKLLGLSQAQ